MRVTLWMNLIFWGEGRQRGSILYSLKIVDSDYASQHCVAFVLGATQTKKISLVVILIMGPREVYICTSDLVSSLGCLIKMKSSIFQQVKVRPV